MEENKDKKLSFSEPEFISLSAASKIAGYTPEYLNSLSRKGTFRAKKIGRNWYTTEEWIGEFLASVSEKKSKDKKAKKADKGKDSLSLQAGSEIEAVGAVDENEKIPEEVAERYAIEEDEKYSDSEEEKIGFPEARQKFKIRYPSKSNWFQLFAALSSMVVVMPLVFATTYFFKKNGKDLNLEIAGKILSSRNLDSVIVNENIAQEIIDGQDGQVFYRDGLEQILNQNGAGQVAGEEDANSLVPVVLASENYKISDVNFGGDTMLVDATENLPLEITDVRSESFVAGKKDEVKLVISWKTNKPAVSDLEYSKNNGQSTRAIKERAYGFTHSVVLSELEPRTSYVYLIKSRDRWGNEISSNYYGIYTASKPVSIFDLISNAMNEVFGWALNN